MTYCYSNNGLSWRMVGAAYTAETGEVLSATEMTTDQLTAAFAGYANAASNASVYQQIAALEALQTPRMLREAQSGATGTFPASESNFPSMTSAQALASIETKVAALRAQLK